MLSPEREGRLTASWHADALGYGYLSGKAAWERWNGLSEPDDTAKRFMAWGHDHESDAVAYFEGVTGIIPDRTGDDQLFTPFDVWSGCTTDGLIEDWGILECKAPRSLPEKPKDGHWVQVQSQLHITQRQTGYLSIWTPDGSSLWTTQAIPVYWTLVEPLLKTYHAMLCAPKPPGRWKKPKLDFNFQWERVK